MLGGSHAQLLLLMTVDIGEYVWPLLVLGIVGRDRCPICWLGAIAGATYVMCMVILRLRS